MVTLMRDWWMEADGLRQWRSTAGAGASEPVSQSAHWPVQRIGFAAAWRSIWRKDHTTHH